MTQSLRSRYSTQHKPGSSSLVFHISYTDGLLNEEEVKHAFKFVSSILVDLGTSKSSLRSSSSRPNQVRNTSQVEQETIEGIRQDPSDGQIWVESKRVPSLA